MASKDLTKGGSESLAAGFHQDLSGTGSEAIRGAGPSCGPAAIVEYAGALSWARVYIRDSGLLHALLGLGTGDAIEGHPKLGASWEGFCIENILGWMGDRNAWFWSTHANAELDLLVFRQGLRIGFEFKFADAPRLTRSMHIAHEDLKLDRLLIVYPGTGGSFPLEDWAEAVSIRDLEARVGRLMAADPR